MVYFWKQAAHITLKIMLYLQYQVLMLDILVAVALPLYSVA